MPSDLAVLSAEHFGGAAFTSKAGKANGPASLYTDEWPRKRARTSEAAVVTEMQGDGDEEKLKRTRGRPRLDTKDQTAAERRRTQIRLAQRAYRSRKETAIQTLERRVQGLQDTNEEMGNAFMQFHDFAVSLGLLEQAPEFARELRATTKKFLSLARRSSKDGEQDDQDNQDESSVRGTDRSPRQGWGENSSSPEVIGARSPIEQTVLPWGGYMIRTEPEISSATPVPDLSNSVPTTALDPLDYEIITMPTPENASFPFGQHQDTQLPDIFGQNQPHAAYPLTPFSTLPLPSSLAYSECTFGRRLQRTALERGYQLITMANPPKERFAMVFGFCMLFEPLDKIRERMRASLDRTRTESLNYWQTPFWALGGAGQHHIQQDPGRGRVGNQGTEDHLKHGFAAGPGGHCHFGLGPFDSKTAEARDAGIDPRMRITLPGFRGDFYDAEEVELYLQSRGVVIQPGQDYLTTKVDVASFEGGGGGARGQRSGPGVDDWPQNIDDAFDFPSSSASPGTVSGAEPASLAMPDIPSSNSAWPVHDGGALSGMGDLQSHFPEYFTGGIPEPGGLADGASTLDFAGDTNREDVIPESRKRLVTLDVNAFIGGK